MLSIRRLLDRLGRRRAQVSSRAVGFDAGTVLLKAIEVENAPQGPRAGRHIIVPLPGSPHRDAALAREIRAFLSGLDGAPMTAIVPGDLLSIETIPVTARTREQERRLLPYYLDGRTKAPLNGLAGAIGRRVPDSEAPAWALVAWTARSRLRGAGLWPLEAAPDHAEPAPTALLTWMHRVFGPLPSAHVAVVDLGWSGTDVLLIREQVLGAARTAPLGLSHLVQALADGARLSREEAHAQLMRDGVSRPPTATVRELVVAVARLARSIRVQFVRTLYTDGPRPVRPARVVLLGGGALVPGLDARLSGLLEVPVERLTAPLPGMDPALVPLLAPAAGAALATLDQGTGLDLLAPMAAVDPQEPMRARLLWPATMVALSLLIHSGAYIVSASQSATRRHLPPDGLAAAAEPSLRPGAATAHSIR